MKRTRPNTWPEALKQCTNPAALVERVGEEHVNDNLEGKFLLEFLIDNYDVEWLCYLLDHTDMAVYIKIDGKNLLEFCDGNQDYFVEIAITMLAPYQGLGIFDLMLDYCRDILMRCDERPVETVDEIMNKIKVGCANFAEEELPMPPPLESQLAKMGLE